MSGSLTRLVRRPVWDAAAVMLLVAVLAPASPHRAAQAASTANRSASEQVPTLRPRTRGEAQRSIVRAGFTAVMNLSRSADGVWAGTAIKNGAVVTVAVARDGRVTEGGDWL